MLKIQRKPVSTVLNLKFSYDFKTPVWEVKSSDGFLVINNRDSDSLQSSFALFDLDQNELSWENLEFDDSWWVNAYHITDSQIVFQKFEDSQDIENRSVFGFDLTTQEVSWSLENVLLIGASDDQIFLRQKDDEELLFNIDSQEWENKKNERIDSIIDFPLHYEADSDHFDTLAKFLKKKVNIDLTGSCDYLEYRGLIFISANHEINREKALSLYIFSSVGNLLLEETLDKGMKGLVSGSFFIVNGAVIFVQNKTQLKIYSIDEKV